jgi:hypothetical protein
LAFSQMNAVVLAALGTQFIVIYSWVHMHSSQGMKTLLSCWTVHNKLNDYVSQIKWGIKF